jgi:hypothetical protein
MNGTLQERLATGTIAPGMLGFGMRLPDSTCLSYSFNEACPREHLDQILHQLAGMMTLLAGHGLAPKRLIWTFERGQIFMIMRPDGALLAFAAEPNTDAAANADQFAEAFFALKSNH